MKSLTYSDVVKQLDNIDENICYAVLTLYKALGGKPGTWRPKDQTAMATAITKFEDQLEYAKPRYNRTKLRTLRQRVEQLIP